jgi:fructokinase
MKCIAFGEVLWDVIDGEEHLGGAPLNLLAHASIMGAESFLVSAVGKDERGERIEKKMEDLGVKKELLQKNEFPTGWVDVVLSEDGQPEYTIHENVAFDNIEYTSALKQVLQDMNFDIFCFGTLAQRSDVSRATLEEIFAHISAKEVFYDVNLRQSYYSKEIVEASLKHATIIKLNDHEVEVLSELLFDEKMDDSEFSKKLIVDFDIHIVVVTKGKRGCSVYSDQEAVHVDGVEVVPADTVGAGDAFSAGFLNTYIRTGDIHQSAEFANKVGAYVTSQHGAIPLNKSYIDEL